MVVIDKNQAIGKVNERQLLTELYQKRIGPSNRIASILDPKIFTVKDTDSLDYASELLTTENLIVVLDSLNKPKGIITRIDLIEYYS